MSWSCLVKLRFIGVMHILIRFRILQIFQFAGLPLWGFVVRLVGYWIRFLNLSVCSRVLQDFRFEKPATPYNSVSGVDFMHPIVSRQVSFFKFFRAYWPRLHRAGILCRGKTQSSCSCSQHPWTGSASAICQVPQYLCCFWRWLFHGSFRNAGICM